MKNIYRFLHNKVKIAFTLKLFLKFATVAVNYKTYKTIRLFL